jgi:3-hydroxybutyryl-CoA dehydratase
MSGPGTICLQQNLNYLDPVQIGDIVLARVEIAELIRDRRRVPLLYDCWVDTKKVLDG